MKFDPMTGEPINEESQVTPEVTETPVTPENPLNQAVESVKSWISTMSTKQWFLPAMIGGGVGVVAIIVAVVAIVGGAFMSPVQKVTYAAGNTFKEAGVLGDVISSTLTAAANNNNTTYFMLGLEGNEMEMELRTSGKDKQVWVKADIANYPELEGTLTLNKNELQAQAPILGDYVFFYDYTKEADGYTGDTWCIDCNTKIANGSILTAARGTCGENLTWTLVDGVLTISGSVHV